MKKQSKTKEPNSGIFSMFKYWWSSTKPSKGIFILMCILTTIAYSTWIIIPVFAAKVITSLTVANYTGAILNLLLGFTFLFCRNIILHCVYSNRKKLLGPPYVRVNSMLADKMHKAANFNFHNTSKETIINRIHSDVYRMSNFTYTLTHIVGIMMRVIITLITILVINPVIGVVVIIINILDFFIIDFITKRTQEIVRKIRINIDEQFQVFSEIIDSRKDVSNLGVQRKLEAKHKEINNKYIKLESKKDFYLSAQDNFFYIFWNIIVMSITMVFILLISKGRLSLELYLILVTYFANGIEICNSVYSNIPIFKEAIVSTNRVNEILNFSERERKSYGRTNKFDIYEYIDFKNVNYNGTDENPPVSNISFSIRAKDVTLIHGAIQSGKRTIFHLLFRSIYPTNGRIYIDGLQYRYLSKKGFKNLFGYVTANPFMLKGSIIYNLKIVQKDNAKITKICKDLKIYDEITKLPKGFETQVSQVNKNLLYFIALARAILSNVEVIALYEFPSVLTESEINRVKNIIKTYKNENMFIIFTATDKYFDISDKIIEMEAGKVKGIYYNE